MVRRIEEKQQGPHRWTMWVLPVCLVLAACDVTPTSVINSGPKLLATVPVPPANGSVFQADSFHPIFEDLRARHVGDVITVILNENTTAGKQGANSSSKSGSFKAAVSLANPSYNNSASATTDSKLNEAGKESASNNFNGSISVQVVAVDPKGNLVVSGEKQVALDRGVEYIRFSGVVYPYTITSTNQVLSTQVADVRVEYRSSSRLDLAAIITAFSRIFLTVALPF